MEPESCWAIEWRRDDDVLLATEPTRDEIRSASALLASYYNDAHNRRMMAHDEELAPDDVVAYYEELREEGGRPFLLARAGVLMGDADLRNIEGTSGELAIMIGGRVSQGHGLGTRYAIMLHAFAFRILGLERVYVSIIPGNAASRRLFEKLGYEPDDTPEARTFVDDETDVTMSLPRARFESARLGELSELRLYQRATEPVE
jgi:RimJ/RimL family protein N-acetyltransferase